MMHNYKRLTNMKKQIRVESTFKVMSKERNLCDLTWNEQTLQMCNS